MMGLEALLHKFTGGNDALLMLAAFSLLIAMNFVTSMWVEIANKDLKWNDLWKFAKPIILNGMFLLGLELIMIPAARTPLAMDIFSTVQMGGWLGVMGFYFFGFYQNLKKLGMKGNKRIDDAMHKLEEEDEEDNK